MTSSELPTGRPVPDTDDLRLLAEIVNHGAIGLPQAAWNARMSQSEAAARLVQMAERNLPLRLVAEGDRQALWRITQAGPATGGVQLGGLTQPPAGQPAAPVAAPMQRPESPRPTSGPVSAAAQPAAAPPLYPPPQTPLTGAQPAVPGGYPPGGPGAGPGYPPPGGFPPPAVQVPIGGANPSGVAVPMGGPGPLIASGPVVLPPTSAVPPHEQAIAGAVPLGQPPFGTPPLASTGTIQAEPFAAEPSSDDPEPTDAQVPPEPVGVTPVESALPEVQPDGAAAELEPPAAGGSAPVAVASTWGIPGSSDWARGDQPAAAAPGAAPGAVQVPAAGMTAPEATQAWSPEFEAARSEPAGSDGSDGSDDQLTRDGAAASAVADQTSPGPASAGESAPNPEPETNPEIETNPEPEPSPEPEPEPRSQVHATSPSQVQWQTTTGLSGEQLWVTLLEVIDPGDQVLTQAGYRLEPGERALLVRTAMANHGPAPHDSLPDHYLVLQAANGAILPKAPMGVGSHPAYRVGVSAGGQADGWTVFLVPADTVVTTVIWSVRPDLVDRTLTWRV